MGFRGKSKAPRQMEIPEQTGETAGTQVGQGTR